MPDSYTREWHEERMDRAIGTLAQAVQAWTSRNREDPRATSSAAGLLQLVMRSVSAEAAAIASIDSQAYWSGGAR